MPTVGEIQRRSDMRLIETARRRDEVRDLRLACAALYIAGADDDEVDSILSERPVPMNPDLEWARVERSRYLRVRGLIR